MNPTEQAIADYLLDHGPANWDQITQRFKDRPLSGVTFALDQLVRNGEIKTEDQRLKDGREVRVYRHPEGRSVPWDDAAWLGK